MTSDGAAGEDGGERRTADAWRFTDWVGRQARRTPGRTAVIDADGGERLTYAELDRAVDRTAGRLGALGLEPGDHLGALVGTRVAAVRLVHAAARRGVTLVPVDPRGGADAVWDRLDRADATAVVCERPTEAVAVEALSEGVASSGRDDEGDLRLPLASVDEAASETVTPLESVDPAAVAAASWGMDDRLLVLFTSGTTGASKPVSLTAGNVLASALGSALRLGHVPGDRWLCALPAYHMGGIAPFYRTAVYGTTAVVVERERLTGENRAGGDAGERDPTGRAGFDAEGTLRALDEHEATGVSLVPTQLRRLLDAAAGAEGPDALPDSLRFVLLGGGPAPETLIERCDRRDVPVCPTYGLTETASQVTTARPATATENVGTVGPPLALTDVVVARHDERTSASPRDDEDRAPPGYRACADGREGEVLVRGPTVTPGYYGAPERTAEAFAGDWLRTGDRGHLTNGRLSVHGRRDDRIVTGGENVASAAVERALRPVEGVRAVAVVGVPDPEWGERVAALVVREDDTAGENGDETGDGETTAGPTREGLLAACRERLPGPAVPRTLRFVDALPRTASGTVDRAAARDLVDETDDTD